LSTKRDHDVALALGARPIQQHEPPHVTGRQNNVKTSPTMTGRVSRA